MSLHNISIIIPTHNRKDKLRNILSQLKDQKLNSEIKFYIIVVVDGCVDGTLEMLKHNYPETHIVEGDGNWWYTKSMNEGFKYSMKLDPDYIITLNDDIEIDENYVSVLLNSYKYLNNENAIIGSLSITNDKYPKILFAGIKEYKWFGLLRIPIIYPLAIYYKKCLDGIYPTVELPGRGMLIPVHILKTLNYFDEKFVQYASDTDFCFRAIRNNINIYINYKAVVISDYKKTRVRNLSESEKNRVETIKDIFRQTSHESLQKYIRLHRKHFNSMHLIWKIPLYLLRYLIFK